jgi:hypothetical protein
MIARFLVDKETYYQRLSVCVSCDKFDSSLNTCTLNDKFIPKLIRFNLASCPIDKWQTIGVDESEKNY